MYAIIGSIIAKIGWSLLTEKVVKEIFINTAWFFAEKSDNKLDDKHVKTLAEALGVKVE